MIVEDFLFVKWRWVYVGLPSELSILNSFIKQPMYCDLQTKTMLLGALSAGATTAYCCINYWQQVLYQLRYTDFIWINYIIMVTKEF